MGVNIATIRGLPNFFINLKQGIKPDITSKVPRIDGVGDVYYIDHVEDESRSTVRFTQHKWLEEIEKNNQPFKVQCIFGEVKDLAFVNMILDNEKLNSLCHEITLIFGDKIWDEKSRDDLGECLKKDPKFTAFRHITRPSSHGILLSDKMMLESKHSINETYKKVKAIENASDQVQKIFQKEFSRLKVNSIPVTKENYKDLYLYNN